MVQAVLLRQDCLGSSVAVWDRDGVDGCDQLLDELFVGEAGDGGRAVGVGGAGAAGCAKYGEADFDAGEGGGVRRRPTVAVPPGRLGFAVTAADAAVRAAGPRPNRADEARAAPSEAASVAAASAPRKGLPAVIFAGGVGGWLPGRRIVEAVPFLGPFRSLGGSGAAMVGAEQVAGLRRCDGVSGGAEQLGGCCRQVGQLAVGCTRSWRCRKAAPPAEPLPTAALQQIEVGKSRCLAAR